MPKSPFSDGSVDRALDLEKQIIQSFAKKVADDLHEKALAGATIAELIDYARALSGLSGEDNQPEE